MNINKYFNKLFIISIFSILLTNITYTMEQKETESNDDNEYQDSIEASRKKLKSESTEQTSNESEIKKKLSANCQRSLVYICLYNAIKHNHQLSDFLKKNLQNSSNLVQTLTRLLISSGLLKSEDYDLTEEESLIKKLLDNTGLLSRAQIFSRLVESEDSEGYLTKNEFLIEELLDNAEMLNLALDSGAIVDYQRNYNWTALTWAAWRGYVKAVEILLQRKNLITSMSFKEYLNLPGHFGYSALEFAALAGKGKGLKLRQCSDEEIYLKIVKLLLKNGAENLDHAFQNAILHGNYKIAKFLLDSGAKPTVVDFITIQKNQHKGYLDILSLILEHGININGNDGLMTPLMWAALSGDMDQLSLLTPFINEIKKEPWQINNAFIQAQAARYEKQEDLLEDVESHQERWGIEYTKRLFNVPDEEEYAIERLNALYIGQSKKDYYDIMAVLLNLGADVNEKDNRFKLNALLRATMANDVEVVRLLLKHGVDKEVTDAQGRTPLDIARENGFEDIVSLLENGFLINDFLTDFLITDFLT